MFSSSPSQQVMIDNLRKAKAAGISVKELLLRRENSVPVAVSPSNSNAGSSAGVDGNSVQTADDVVPVEQAPVVVAVDARATTKKFREDTRASSKPPPREFAKTSGKSRSAKRSGTEQKVLKINAESIDEDLERQDTHGTAIRKIAEAMAGFSVERDGIFLDAFRTRVLEYNNFRMLLKRSLSLSFSDLEFTYICSLFDRDGDGTVDGEEFLVVCKLLATAWRKRGLKKNKERDKYLDSVLKEKADTEYAERQAYLENAADFVFAKEDEESMLKKMKKAASKVNKIEPGAPPLHGFEPKYLKPKEAYVTIINTFRVQLSRKEIGALIRMFDFEKRGLLDTAGFMVQFSRWGVEYRDAARSQQIEKTRKSAQDQIDRHNNIMKAQEQDQESGVDMTFTDADKDSAFQKLRAAAKGYRKHSGSGVSLDGFSAVSISPGLFREMIKRTFNVALTGKELGAVVNTFDEAGDFEINCKAFLVFFARAGVEERSKDHSAQLEESRSKYQALKDHHENRIQSMNDKNMISHELLIKVKPEDTESANRKLRFGARHYSLGSCNMPGDLDVFKVDKMTPGIFSEKLQKFLNIILTPVELAAVLIEFDTQGDRLFIDCDKFSKYFKRLGFAEKEKLWEEERERRNKVLEAAVLHKKNLKEKFVGLLETGAVDYSYTKDDDRIGFRKLEVGASQYDPTNPQGISLVAFQAPTITPGQLKEKLKRTLNVDLSPKEVGALIREHLVLDEETGKIDCVGVLKLIKDLAKAAKERQRRKRLEAELAEIEEQKERDRRKQEAKKKAESERLAHEAEDGKTLMKKINNAAQAFAVDRLVVISI
jgi:hypothetical protein